MGLFGGPLPQTVNRSAATYIRQPIPTGDFARIDPSYSGSAIQSIAIRTTVDLIASLSSELPVEVFSGTGSKIATPTNVLDPGGDGLGIEDWVYRLATSWALAGNSFGTVVEWAGYGTYIGAADLLHPDDVSADLVDSKVTWRINGREVTDLASWRHWRVNPMPGRVLGLSPIELHAVEIGTSLSTSRFGNQWFSDGAHPGGILTNDKPLNDDEVVVAKRRFMARTQGSREPLVLGMGWDFKEIQISPEESQFLGTQQFSEAQCARIFGPGFAEILGYSTTDSMTYENIVDRRQDLLVFSMNRWLRRVDRVLSLFLPGSQYVRLNRDALLEPTTIERYRAHALALENRWQTVNEVRAIEKLPPVPWGDEPNDPTPAHGQQGGAS